jgi:hypothetical protein
MLNKRTLAAVSVALMALSTIFLAACSPAAEETAAVPDTAVTTNVVTNETAPVGQAITAETNVEDAQVETVAEAAVVPANQIVVNTAVTLNDDEIAGLLPQPSLPEHLLHWFQPRWLEPPEQSHW